MNYARIIGLHQIILASVGPTLICQNRRRARASSGHVVTLSRTRRNDEYASHILLPASRSGGGVGGGGKPKKPKKILNDDFCPVYHVKTRTPRINRVSPRAHPFGATVNGCSVPKRDGEKRNRFGYPISVMLLYCTRTPFRSTYHNTNDRILANVKTSFLAHQSAASKPCRRSTVVFR